MDATPRAPVNWPLPPFHVAALSLEGDEGLACQITLRDGRVLSGALRRFGPAVPDLDLVPDDGAAPQTLSFEAIRCVRLPKRLALRRERTPLEARATELFQPSDAQTYSLEFPGREVVEGETVGHVSAAQGLFLYVPTDDGSVIRHFYPHSALRGHQFGRPLGALLVEERIVSAEEIDSAVARQHELRSQRIGEFLAQARVVSRDELTRAIKHQEGKPVLRLGEALRQLDLISEDQLQSALARHQQDRRSPLGRILIDMGCLSESALKDVLARKLGIPYVGLASFNFERQAVDAMKKADALRCHAIPLCRHEGALVVAFEDPLDAQALESVRFLAQAPLIPAMASREEIKTAIDRQYGSARPEASAASFAGDYAFHFEVSGDADRLASSLKVEDQGLSLVDEKAESPEQSVARLVTKMAEDACAVGATDIHIEARAGDRSTRIRLRRGGALADYLEVPAASRDMLLARVKSMARLDPAERRKPQNGYLDFRDFGPTRAEFRVATVPTSHGLEDIVLRAVQPARLIPAEDLGFAPDILKQVRAVMARPAGLVLVSGPAGAGKTATVHALLEMVNSPGRKICSVEEAIEIPHEGLRQVEANPKVGWTMAEAVHAFLRADADVIFVGELRDAETARAALEAALSGRLVLSTLQTRSAEESLARLLDLGLNPFSLADAVQAVLSQRMARAHCTRCRQRYEPKAEELAELAREYSDETGVSPAETLRSWQDAIATEGGMQLSRAVGCPHCGGTGYSGRTGVQELLLMESSVRRLMQTRASVEELSVAARAAGMRSLRQDGILNVLRGLTDAPSVRAVCS